MTLHRIYHYGLDKRGGNMIEEIEIPVYSGGWADVFWSKDAWIHVEKRENVLKINANRLALKLLAKQLLYFSCNNALANAHIHYDSFFCGSGFSGDPLIVEFSPCEAVEGDDLYEEDTIRVRLDLPRHNARARRVIAPEGLLICAAVSRIVGDEKAFLFLAKELLALASTQAIDTVQAVLTEIKDAHHAVLLQIQTVSNA